VGPSAYARRSTWAKSLVARYTVYRRYSCGDYAATTPHAQDIQCIFCGDCVVLSPQITLKLTVPRRGRIRQQALVHQENSAEYKLEPGEGLGTAKPKDRQEEYLSQIINRLNEVFVTDQLTDKDMVNYAYTIRDKVGENILVMKKIENNSPEQALLGDFSKAIDDAILGNSEAHQNQMMQLLADPSKAANFARIVFDLLVQGRVGNP
jgi:hypothetical protein